VTVIFLNCLREQATGFLGGIQGKESEGGEKTHALARESSRIIGIGKGSARLDSLQTWRLGWQLFNGRLGGTGNHTSTALTIDTLPGFGQSVKHNPGRKQRVQKEVFMGEGGTAPCGCGLPVHLRDSLHWGDRRGDAGLGSCKKGGEGCCRGREVTPINLAVDANSL